MRVDGQALICFLWWQDPRRCIGRGSHGCEEKVHHQTMVDMEQAAQGSSHGIKLLDFKGTQTTPLELWFEQWMILHGARSWTKSFWSFPAQNIVWFYGRNNRCNTAEHDYNEVSSVWATRPLGTYTLHGAENANFDHLQINSLAYTTPLVISVIFIHYTLWIAKHIS